MRRGRRRLALAGIYPMLVDIVVPVVLYFGLKLLGLPDFVALTAAGIVSGAVAVFEVVLDRRAKGTALFVFVMFLLSIALVFLTHNARLILLRPSVYTEIGGLYVLLTSFRRPFLLDYVEPLLTRGDQSRIGRWKRAWDHSAALRRRTRWVRGGLRPCRRAGRRVAERRALVVPRRGAVGQGV